MTVEDFQEAVRALREDCRIREVNYNLSIPGNIVDLEEIMRIFPPVVPGDTLSSYLGRCYSRLCS